MEANVNYYLDKDGPELRYANRTESHYEIESKVNLYDPAVELPESQKDSLAYSNVNSSTEAEPEKPTKRNKIDPIEEKLQECAFVEEEYFFNERFQSLISKFDAFSDTERNDEIPTLLSKCNSDFTSAVETFGKIIISEKNLPTEKKTIKPINVGGIAGGEKFLHRGILFKYAIDPVIAKVNGSRLYLYGGDSRNDELAMKAAGNELKEAIHRFVTACSHVNNLHTPLMSLCDYYGFRLIAMSVLPITSNTLIYGSSDAGANVLDSNPTFSQSMRTVAEILNLKSHLVGDKVIHTAGDVEGHLGQDGRFYVVDFGRLYPAEAPGVVEQAGGYSTKDKRAVFYQHLRPELVKMNPVPLCSDAFTAWQQEDPNKLVHNQEVKEATERLVNEIIPKCAEELDGMNRIGAISSVTEQIHRRGINLRHMGLLRQYVKQPGMRMILLTEMWIRSLKMVIYRILRRFSYQQRILSDVEAKGIISEVLSLILHPSAFHDFYWKDFGSKCDKNVGATFKYIEEIPSFKYSINQKYGPTALSEVEMKVHLAKCVMNKLALERISQLSCFTIDKERIESDITNENVTEVDVASVEPRIKYTSLIHLCDGLSCLAKANKMVKASKKAPAYLRMMKNAEKHLNKGWTLHPENEKLVRYLAVACLAIAKTLLESQMDADSQAEHMADGILWLEKAGNYFEDAQALFQDATKYIPKNDAKEEDKRKYFQNHVVNSMQLAGQSRYFAGIYKTARYKTLSPHVIHTFERAIYWYLETCKRRPNALMGLIFDDFRSGTFFLCSLNKEFKEVMKQTYKPFQTQIQNIRMGTAGLLAPMLLTSAQIDTMIELYEGFQITELDFTNCSCLDDKSIAKVLQHFNTITDLNLTGIPVNENMLIAIGTYGTALKTLIMQNCSLTNEVISTWTPAFWKLNKNQPIPLELEYLDIEGHPQLKDESILALVKRLVNLKKLNIKSCSVSEEAIAKIKIGYPNLELLYTRGDLGISEPLSMSLKNTN